MTNTQNYEEIKALLDEKQNEITDLEAHVVELKTELDNLKAESKRVAIEARLAIDDAELARSFSRKNYQGLVKELIEHPLKRFRRAAYFIVLFAIVISVGTSVFTVFYIGHQSNNPLKEIMNLLMDSPVPAETQATTTQTTPEAINNESQDPFKEISTPTETKQTVDTSTPPTPEPATTRPPAPSEEELKKVALIERQSAAILAHIKTSETKGEVQLGYRENVNKLVQLYLITMQNALKESVLYESYLAVFDTLKINDSIKPSSIEELVAIDTQFLRASYSGYTITHLKSKKGWRYRDSDRRFTSYYGKDNGYSLEGWQIVNDSKDYKTLPFVFVANIKRIVNQLAFNQQFKALNISNQLTYNAYKENNKNNAVSKLLNNASFTTSEGMLIFDISRLPLNITKNTVVSIQQELVKAGVLDAAIINGVAGSSTEAAIKTYRKANQLPDATHIDLFLLNSLGIDITYRDILFATPRS